MKFVQAAISSALLFASYCLQEVASHAVETRYCVTSGGDLRIFIEHWHRFLTDFTNVGTMTITDLGTSTNHTLDPTGILVDVPWDQIHVPGDCAGGSTTIETSTCGADNFSTGQLTSLGGKTEDNWVYYDFEIQCNVLANYRLIQGNTVVLMEGCDELYPVDINTVFTDCDPTSAPTPAPIPATPSPSVIPATPSPSVIPSTPPTAEPNTPGGHDDPHLYTWNGVLYDYHGVCDMIYTTCPSFDGGKGLHMHIRTEFVEPSKWSTISSLAVMIGDHVLEVKSNGMHYLNGVADADLSEADLSGHTLKRRTRFAQNRLRILYEVELNDHSLLEILTKSPTNDGSKFGDRTSLSFQVKGAHDHRRAGGADFSDCAGLSNTWEEPDEGHYLVGRSGELYEYHRAHEFAPEWQVDQDKNDPMLFEEDIGLQLPQQECIKSPILVADKRHLSKFYEADGGTRQLKAENACGHLVADDLFDACFFDVLVTGDVTFAEEPWYNN